MNMLFCNKGSVYNNSSVSSNLKKKDELVLPQIIIQSGFKL